MVNKGFGRADPFHIGDDQPVHKKHPCTAAAKYRAGQLTLLIIGKEAGVFIVIAPYIDHDGSLVRKFYELPPTPGFNGFKRDTGDIGIVLARIDF